jgi:hypothetical protein
MDKGQGREKKKHRFNIIELSIKSPRLSCLVWASNLCFIPNFRGRAGQGREKTNRFNWVYCFHFGLLISSSVLAKLWWNWGILILSFGKVLVKLGPICPVWVTLWMTPMYVKHA